MFFTLVRDYIQINITIAGIYFLAKFMTILQSVELSNDSLERMSYSFWEITDRTSFS